jgi:hypothetical protein
MKRTNVVSMRSLLSGSARYKPIATHRGFMWSPAEVAQLLVDLELAAKADEHEDEETVPHERFYLGVMTVNHFRGGQYIVIDGQQRLVTLALILAFARDRIEDAGERQRLDRMLVRRSLTKSPEARIRLSPEDHAWFSHFILPPGATRRLPANAPIGSPRALLLAARFMEQAFLSYSQDDLITIADYIRRHAAFVRTVTVDANAFVPEHAPPAHLPAPQAQQPHRVQPEFTPQPRRPFQPESINAQYARRAAAQSQHQRMFGIAAE